MGKSYNLLTFGFGCIQRPVKDGENWDVQNWQYNSREMPTIKFRSFTVLPKK